jgi:hypothetical protein
MTLLRTFAFLAVSSALAGCVSKPTVQLDHAEIAGVQFGWPPSLAVQMNVYIDVTNPNSYDVAVRAVHGQATLMNNFVLPVEFRAQDPGIWMPAKQTTVVQVPINVPVQTGLAILSQLYSPSIPYHFVGRADVTATRTLQLEKDDYSVDESGSIPSQQLQGALRFAAPLGR